MSTPVSGPPSGSAPPPTLPPGPASAAGSAGLSGGAKAVIASVVVAIIAVAVLAAGLVPGVHLFPSGSTSTGVSSSTALGDASQDVSAHHVGSLTLLVGLDATYSFQFGKVTGNVSCPVTDPLTTNFTVPADTGGYSSGNANLWLFVYNNTTSHTVSVIAVAGGTAYFLGSTTGALCNDLGTLSALPATFVSSTNIASNVDADAGSFLSAHSSANAAYVLLKNGTAPAEWAVVFTNCSYDPATMTASGGTEGDLFLAEASAVTGVVGTSEDLVGAANCSALANTTSIGASAYELAMSVFTSTSSGSTYYEELTLAPTAGLKTSLFGLDIRTATDVFLPLIPGSSGCVFGALPTACKNGTGGWYAVLVNGTGVVVGTWTSEGWGNLAPATTNLTLTNAITLWIVSDAEYDAQGYTLSAFPTGSPNVLGSVVL
jgi:hypothetical protein